MTSDAHELNEGDTIYIETTSGFWMQGTANDIERLSGEIHIQNFHEKDWGGLSLQNLAEKTPEVDHEAELLFWDSSIELTGQASIWMPADDENTSRGVEWYDVDVGEVVEWHILDE